MMVNARRILELLRVFARLGVISFGGPAAHIALMERELVQKRDWLDHQTFLDMLSISQLIPGPNSTELAIHIGYKRAGWLGLVAAGIAFIVPAMVIVACLAFLYERYAMLPILQNMLLGIKPVIVAIIAHSVWQLAKSAVKNRHLAIVAACSLLFLAFGVHELLTILLAGLVYWAWMRWRGAAGGTHLHPATGFTALAMFAGSAFGTTSSLAAKNMTSFFPLSELFWTFLKIGAVLYGSGYVLIAYLQRDFVDRLGVLTQQQLLDAVTIGQFTPGPLFTTATFIGYLTHGFSGAWLATLAIFLPAFVFVAIVAPWMVKLRANAQLAQLLDGINCASLAFIAWIGFTLVRDIATQPLQLIIASAAFLLMLRFSWNSAWYVLVGAIIGILLHIFS